MMKLLPFVVMRCRFQTVWAGPCFRPMKFLCGILSSVKVLDKHMDFALTAVLIMEMFAPQIALQHLTLCLHAVLFRRKQRLGVLLFKWKKNLRRLYCQMLTGLKMVAVSGFRLFPTVVVTSYSEHVPPTLFILHHLALFPCKMQL